MDTEVIIKNLVELREALEVDGALMVEASPAVVLADVCRALALAPEDTARVLGERAAADVNVLENTHIVPSDETLEHVVTAWPGLFVMNQTEILRIIVMDYAEKMDSVTLSEFERNIGPMLGMRRCLRARRKNARARE